MNWHRTYPKPRPKEIDDWTHYLYDATGNAEGEKLAEQKPDSPPTFDGMVAGGRLYVSTVDGTVLCFGGR
ncbi:MAG: hypothetical protein HQ582_15200 [Planctomycetes bacterium]|nr:hypothetical protein [Planctomycetota bacterium]